MCPVLRTARKPRSLHPPERVAVTDPFDELDRSEVKVASETHYRKLERMYATGPVTRLYGTTLKVGKDEAVVTMPVKEEFFHAGGALHGSAYFRALDDAACFAANSLIEDSFLLTLSFTIYLVRQVTKGTLTATGRVVHRSPRVIIAESELVAERGKVVARGSGGFSVPPRRATKLDPTLALREE